MLSTAFNHSLCDMAANMGISDRHHSLRANYRPGTVLRASHESYSFLLTTTLWGGFSHHFANVETGEQRSDLAQSHISELQSRALHPGSLAPVLLAVGLSYLTEDKPMVH